MTTRQGYELFGSAPTGSDDDYYLNLTKAGATGAKADVLAIKMLSKNYTGVTWELVVRSPRSCTSLPSSRLCSMHQGRCGITHNNAYCHMPELTLVQVMSAQAHTRWCCKGKEGGGG